MSVALGWLVTSPTRALPVCLTCERKADAWPIRGFGSRVRKGMTMKVPYGRLTYFLLAASAIAAALPIRGAAARLATAASNAPPAASAPIAHLPGALPPASTTPSPDAPPSAPTATAAILRGLNKITGRVTTIVAPIGQPVRFGALQIVAHTCVQRPPTAPPDDIAFLSIDDVKQDGTAVRIFTGWMFKSSPSLSALQNPVYDVWVEGCKF